MPPIVVLSDIGSDVLDGCINIDFLLPNGIVIPISTDFFKPFEIIKQEVFKQAENYPLYRLLKTCDCYCFVCLNRHGEKEEILDESQTLDDIRPNCAFLKLVERQGDERHKTLLRNINDLIGKDPQKHEKLEAWQNVEIADFKNKMKQMCDSVVAERKKQGWQRDLLYRFPPRLRPTVELISKVKERLSDCFVVEVYLPDTDSTRKLQVDGKITPGELIKMVLQKLSQRGTPMKDYIEYLLKCYALEEYIYGLDYPLQQYKYVYNCLVKNQAPHFRLVLREKVIDCKPAIPPRRPSNVPNSLGNQLSTEQRSEKETSVWDIQDKYYFTIRGLNKVQLPDGAKVKLFMGLYHGSETLCGIKTSDEILVQDGAGNVRMDIVFDISTCDLPHMARICFTLCATTQKKDLTSVAWVNVPVFDFRSRLTRCDRDLPMWPWTDDMQSEEFCYPIGSVAPNAQGNEATTLLIKFPDFNQKCNIRYPAFDKVLECAAKNMEPNGTPGSAMMRASKSHLEQLEMVIQKDTLQPLFEQDKELLWVLRYDCADRFPHSLPKVLSSVKWNSHADVAKMIALLQTWPKLRPDAALQLLDFNYPDENVRKFAISCLQNKRLFSDDELSRYLLQLVQALKYETHLLNPLVKFLLTKALKNKHIGHQLFWLLKSEMHNPYVSVQYRLILEVYLIVSEDQMIALSRQQEALSKLLSVNGVVKRFKMGDQKASNQACKDMQLILEQPNHKEVLSNLYSPLSPLFKLVKLNVEKCRVMKSKKRPLMMFWGNEDGQDLSFFFKNGDDLRQDMLTLQMLDIMDNIWQSEGLDLRMNVYRCLATGQEQGVIERVENAETLAKIQSRRGAFDKKALFEWLKQHNQTPEALDEAVEEFILSCAGYCVATYILGIGDRHNDNIMLKRTGQLFHIDFGHFLGNFKSKFGVRRERVPFVLTTHFVHVIQKGSSNNESFKRFQKYCESAYLILRRKATLLFSLFLMMLSSGIPQLTCIKDVDYLRETLKPDLTEEEARAHFSNKIQEALKNSWTTSMNWFIHLKAQG